MKQLAQLREQWMFFISSSKGFVTVYHNILSDKHIKYGGEK